MSDFARPGGAALDPGGPGPWVREIAHFFYATNALPIDNIATQVVLVRGLREEQNVCVHGGAFKHLHTREIN